MPIDERDYIRERSPYAQKIVLKQQVPMNTGMNYIPKSLVFGVITLLAMGNYIATRATNEEPTPQQNVLQKQIKAQPSEEKGRPNRIDKTPAQTPITAKTIQREKSTSAIANSFESSYRPEADCVRPTTELKRLECKNRRDMALQSYVRLRMK